MKLILLTQVFATVFMVGLIWFVQIVHYPLYANVGREQFPEYEAHHNRLTTWVVGPAMLVEMVTAVALLRYSPGGSTSLVWLGLGLLVVIWISTATLSVPAHDELTGGFSAGAHTKLVSTNWIRTFAWSVRAVIVMIITYRSLEASPGPL
jgi:uncharacterized membrane protein